MQDGEDSGAAISPDRSAEESQSRRSGGLEASPIIIFTTVGDRVAAEKLALDLVSNRLAACVNIIPEILSVYFWEGKLARENEAKLFVKTSSETLPAATAFIKENHPYQMPEITVLGKNGELAMQDDYWAWLKEYVGR